MKLRINASTPVLRRYLEVDETSVVYCQGETASVGGVMHIDYKDIDAVLRDHALLSIQVGTNIYKLPYVQTNREHTQAVAMLIEGCRRTRA
jgi:hypothetical protein